MAVNAPVSCRDRSSIAIAFTVQVKPFIIVHEKRFQLHIPFECWWIIENAMLFLGFLKWCSTRRIGINKVFYLLNFKFFVIQKEHISQIFHHTSVKLYAINLFGQELFPLEIIFTPKIIMGIHQHMLAFRITSQYWNVACIWNPFPRKAKNRTLNVMTAVDFIT